jgi:hypothetical protein
LETALKGDAAYNTHRARWLEKRAAEVLEAAMTPDETHLGVGFAYEQRTTNGSKARSTRFSAAGTRRS